MSDYKLKDFFTTARNESLRQAWRNDELATRERHPFVAQYTTNIGDIVVKSEAVGAASFAFGTLSSAYGAHSSIADAFMAHGAFQALSSAAAAVIMAYVVELGQLQQISRQFSIEQEQRHAEFERLNAERDAEIERDTQRRAQLRLERTANGYIKGKLRDFDVLAEKDAEYTNEKLLQFDIENYRILNGAKPRTTH